MANVGGQKKKSVICKCRVLFGPTRWPQTEELVLFSKEGEFTPEQNLSSVLVVSHVKSRLWTERWGVGSYVSTLSKRTHEPGHCFRLFGQNMQATYILRQSRSHGLGQPVIHSRAPVTVLACAGHFGNGTLVEQNM